jgi:transcriptional regulator with XRE-family HTH domain
MAKLCKSFALDQSRSIDRDVGRRIQWYRICRRCTRKKLANYLAISASTLKNIEKGLERPAPDLLAKIADYYRIDIGELFVPMRNS